MEKLRDAVLAIATLLALSLAGCVSGGGQTPDVQHPTGPPENVTADNVGNFTNNSTVEVDDDTRFDPDSTVHAHDYWEGRRTVTLLEEQVAIDWATWTRTCATGARCDQAPTLVVDVPVRPDDPAFVFPGTRSMNLTLTWESHGLEDAVQELRPMVCVSNRGQLPNCQAESVNTNDTHDYAASGNTWELQGDDLLNPWTTDPPHSLKSNWRFVIRPCDDTSDGRCSPQVLPNVGATSFTLKVTIHRGVDDLPVDPPHFAFFGESDRLDVLKDYTVASGQVKSTAGPWWDSARGQTPEPLWQVGGPQISFAKERGRSDQPVVPIQTRSVHVTLRWSAERATELTLKHRTAADAWDAPWISPSQASSCGSGCTEYTIPVTRDQADSPYALQTQWELGIFHAGDDPTPMTDYEVTMDVQAIR